MGKIWQSCPLAASERLAPTPIGNPGSAPSHGGITKVCCNDLSFALQFGHIDDCARIAGKSVHDTRCHRKLPFMCRYKVNSSSLRKETTKKNTVLNSDDNKKNNNNNNVKEEENNDKIGTTTNKNMKEKNAGKQETNNIGDLKNSIKEAIGDIKTKSNNNVVNDVDIGSQSQSMLILIVGGAGIICLIVSTVFVCFWG